MPSFFFFGIYYGTKPCYKYPCMGMRLALFPWSPSSRLCSCHRQRPCNAAPGLEHRDLPRKAFCRDLAASPTAEAVLGSWHRLEPVCVLRKGQKDRRGERADSFMGTILSIWIINGAGVIHSSLLLTLLLGSKLRRDTYVQLKKIKKFQVTTFLFLNAFCELSWIFFWLYLAAGDHYLLTLAVK